MMMMAESSSKASTSIVANADTNLIVRIEKRVGEYVNRPASAALASIVYAEVTIAPDAEPGQRELRLRTTRGISNPMVFEIGQVPEYCRKPMITAQLQVLGKEDLALRKRPANEVEDHVTIPCTLNGQIASGERNRYRFTAHRGQRLVITTRARDLIPFIADAVPGWFQPVLSLSDAQGKEVAYDDDYRFKPDPTIFYEVPRDGEFVLAVYDAIYRGREDFVYRVTIGELPFITSAFPLGGQQGTVARVKVTGWNLDTNVLAAPADAAPGTWRLTARKGEFVSNPALFSVDTLPEVFEKEPNDTVAQAQKVKLPVIINGRMDRAGDWDVFRFEGKSNEMVVAEVTARRLESPLDSVLKLTDSQGKLLAFNDDCEDLGAGANTHPADSYLMTRLPADGTYFVHLGDTARAGGEAYAYRLRLSAPQPDFALRVVPSSIALRSKSTAQLSVYAIRKDGFTNAIKLALKDPVAGFSAVAVSLSGTQAVARFNIKTDLVKTEEPVNLTVVGSARIGDEEVSHEAVPAEDRMQAFLWRHLVPCGDLKALVFDPNYQPPPRRTPRARPPAEPESKPAVAAANSSGATTNVTAKPKFSKQQVAARLRQLKNLFEEGLLTDDFYADKVAECEPAQ